MFKQLPNKTVKQEYNHKNNYSLFNQKCLNCNTIKRMIVVFDPKKNKYVYKCPNCNKQE